jgi:hypothetical protein
VRSRALREARGVGCARASLAGETARFSFPSRTRKNTERCFPDFKNTTVGLKSRERPIATRREARTFFYLASFVVAPEALLAFFRAP